MDEEGRSVTEGARVMSGTVTVVMGRVGVDCKTVTVEIGSMFDVGGRLDVGRRDGVDCKIAGVDRMVTVEVGRNVGVDCRMFGVDMMVTIDVGSRFVVDCRSVGVD